MNWFDLFFIAFTGASIDLLVISLFYRADNSAVFFWVRAANVGSIGNGGATANHTQLEQRLNTHQPIACQPHTPSLNLHVHSMRPIR